MHRVHKALQHLGSAHQLEEQPQGSTVFDQVKNESWAEHDT